MIEVYKIIYQKYDCAVAPELIFNPNSVTIGNNYRLFKQRCSANSMWQAVGLPKVARSSSKIHWAILALCKPLSIIMIYH